MTTCFRTIPAVLPVCGLLSWLLAVSAATPARAIELELTLPIGVDVVLGDLEAPDRRAAPTFAPQGEPPPRRPDNGRPPAGVGGGGIPRPSGDRPIPRRVLERLNGEGALGLAVADESWLNWWELNRDRLLDVERRYRDRSRDQELSVDVFVGITGSQPAPTADARRIDGLVARLVPLLAHDNAAVRAQTALAIGRVGAAGDLKHLIPLAKDSDGSVRRAAILGAGLLQTPRAVSFLTHVLNDRAAQNAERAYAAVALGLTGAEEAVTALTRHFSSVPQVREVDAGALWGLGISGTPRARVFLEYRFLERSGHDQERAVAANALALFRSSAVLPLLAGGLHDADVEVRRSSVMAIGAADLSSRKRAELERLRAERGVWTGDGVSLNSGTDLDAQVATLMLAVAEEEKTLEARRRIAVAALIEAAVEDADLMVRNLAMTALGALGGAEATAFLVAELDQTASAVTRPYVVLGLALSSSAVGRARLMNLLETDRVDHDTKAAVMLALGLLNHAPAGPELARRLRSHSDTLVAGFAALSCGLLNRTEVAETLRRDLLSKSRPELKPFYGVASALLADGESIDALGEILESSATVNTKIAVAHALAAIKDRKSVDRLMRAIEGGTLKDAALAAAIHSVGVTGERGDVPILSPVFRDLNWLSGLGPMNDIARL